MQNSNPRTAARVVVDVGTDRLAAHICLRDAGDVVGLTVEEVLDALDEAKVLIDDSVTQRAADFVERSSGDSALSEWFLIAEGRPATEGKDAEFSWSGDFQREAEAWQSDAPINYYKMSRIVTVEAGTAIGTLEAAIRGEPGMDVHGKAIRPRHLGSEIELDGSVARSEEDPRVVIAMMPGRVVFNKRRLSIVEALDCRGDVDFETGSVDSSVEVHIGGTVRDEFEVKSARSIRVGGAIEAAIVEAQGDILVRGGILGHHRGSVRAGGDIVARFCAAANLHAGGSISIYKEAGNSEMHAEGRFLAAQGTMIGGRLYAREGVEVATLGSEAGIATSVIVGIHPDVLTGARTFDDEMAARAAMVTKIRQTVQSLLASQKRLTPSQKKRATELLREAASMEEGIEHARRCRDDMLADARAENIPGVLVNRIVHAGVRIQIGRRRTVFQTNLRGPVRIEKRKLENVTEFVAVNQLTGSVTVLPSIRLEANQWQDAAPFRARERPQQRSG